MLWKIVTGMIALSVVLFSIGWILNLATVRMLIIRSLLCATGSVLATVIAQKAIVRFAEPSTSEDVSTSDLNLQEFIGDESTSESDTDRDLDAVAESGSEEREQGDDLQDSLEDQVEEGNGEGVEQIADLISDSMDSENE